MSPFHALLLLLLGANVPLADAASMKGVRGNKIRDLETGSSQYTFAIQGKCPQKEFLDVVIIGAGMAGIAAAARLQEIDPTLSYVILESTSRMGGRVRSHHFGIPGNRWIVEDGANWLIDFQGNPIMDLAKARQGFGYYLQNFSNYVVYDEQGKLVDPLIVQATQNSFQNAVDAAVAASDNQWTDHYTSFPDRGVLDLLAQHGWKVSPNASGDLAYIVQWEYLDYEYSAADVSVRWFPSTDDPSYIVTDQNPKGFEVLIDDYAKDHIILDRIKYSSRVQSVDYNVSMPHMNGINYKAIVHVSNGTGCTDYYARRVISTVSVGVLNSGLITFNPPLAYPAADYNPFFMAQYVKIFYQFKTKFWDSTEFILVMRDPAHRGECHHWGNLDMDGMQGSNIIRCEIMTEAFEKLIDPTTKVLSNATLLALLDPLRSAYGSDVVKPVDWYYPKLNKDPNVGFGAYGDWKIGKTFDDFAKFFGVPILEQEHCQHNGCNSQKEWIVHLSGSASCYEYGEFVHGAFFAGVRNANYALVSLGYSKVKTGGSPCDVDWSDLL